jgi:hypothetical protein
LESKLTLDNPGEYKDLDQMKKLDVDEGEGLQALLTTVVSSGEDMNFMLQHRCVSVPSRFEYGC